MAGDVFNQSCETCRFSSRIGRDDMEGLSRDLVLSAGRVFDPPYDFALCRRRAPTKVGLNMGLFHTPLTHRLSWCGEHERAPDGWWEQKNQDVASG